MGNMKVSEIIVRILELRGYKHVFMVTGGGSMHLNDSFGRSKIISVVPLHHEQSCSIAAESYYRTANLPAIVNVTTGPGGINALTGVYGAYVDSIPLIIISGQVRSDHLVKNIGRHLRQFGDQEADIISISKPITKSSIQLTRRMDIVKVINDQITLAISDRPGPVWIDIPLDIQAAELNISMKELTAKTKKVSINRQAVSKEQINQLEKLQDMLIEAKRPIIIAGNGIRLSNSVNKFHNLLEKIKIPACAVWNSHDLVSNDNPFFAGRPGVDGERAGNFNMQNSDLLIILGARMHVRQVGFNHQSFARNAKKVMVDIDLQELNKPNLGIDLKIQMDLSSFLGKFIDLLDSKDHSYNSNNKHKSFLNWCKRNVQDLQVMQPHHYKPTKGTVNPYLFVERLFERLDKNATAIINIDDPCCKRILDNIKCKYLTYGFNNKATINIKKYLLGLDKTSATISYKNINYLLKTPLIGKFNLYNLLAAITCSVKIGINIKNAIKAAEGFKYIPGRFEKFTLPAGRCSGRDCHGTEGHDLKNTAAVDARAVGLFS